MQIEVSLMRWLLLEVLELIWALNLLDISPMALKTYDNLKTAERPRFLSKFSNHPVTP